jgi:IMP cyclohydrolase
MLNWQELFYSAIHFYGHNHHIFIQTVIPFNVGKISSNSLDRDIGRPLRRKGMIKYYQRGKRTGGLNMEPNKLAEMNFQRHLRQNPYPGRGLVIGRSSVEDAWLIIYWIMGRSKNSQNRRFVVEGGLLRTEPIDPSLLTDPSLIIYDAMLELPSIYLVSNGDQTRTLYETLQRGGTFDSALATREREPDAPNYTPRISGMLNMREKPVTVALSILKANPINPEFTDRFSYRPAMPVSGVGVGLTTYSGDGTPLPSFAGDPLLLPCQGSAETVLDSYWNALNANNRVAIAVKQIPGQGGSSDILIRNR